MSEAQKAPGYLEIRTVSVRQEPSCPLSLLPLQPHPGTRGSWVSEERGGEAPDREDALLSGPSGKEKEIQHSRK